MVGRLTAPGSEFDPEPGLLIALRYKRACARRRVTSWRLLSKIDELASPVFRGKAVLERLLRQNSEQPSITRGPSRGSLADLRLLISSMHFYFVAPDAAVY